MSSRSSRALNIHSLQTARLITTSAADLIISAALARGIQGEGIELVGWGGGVAAVEFAGDGVAVYAGDEGCAAGDVGAGVGFEEVLAGGVGEEADGLGGGEGCEDREGEEWGVHSI